MMYQPTQPQLQSTSTHLQTILQPHQLQQHQHQHLSSQSMMHQQQLQPHDLALTDIDKEKEKQARENHCEIERRRRVKMAAYFNELCVMVPTCNTLQRKPDKLTILRMASSHMRNLRQSNPSASNNQSLNDNSYKPSFLTDQELKHLILEAADGFLFVSQCDTGNVIYVSDAVQPVLSYLPSEWSNRSLFDFIHPDDLEKVKDQLSTQETSSVNSSGRVLDLKTGTVKKEGHPNSVRSHIGSRRSFICRVRLGHSKQNYVDSSGSMTYPTSSGVWSTTARSNRNRNTLQPDAGEQKMGASYSVIHVTGYTKIWPPNSGSSSANNQNLIDQHNMYGNNSYNMGGMGGHHLEDGQPTTNFHLIAIARIQMTSAPNDLVNSTNCEFVTRHDQNGLVTFVDQRVTGLLGYQPNEMLKKQLSEFCVVQDQQVLNDQLKLVYESKQTQPVQMTLHFVHASAVGTQEQDSGQNIIKFKTSAYAFCNPCNDQFEFIVCTHVNQSRLSELNMNTNSGLFQHSGSHHLASGIDQSQVGLGNLGSQQYQYQNLVQYNHPHMSAQASQGGYQIGQHMSSHLGQQQSNTGMYSAGTGSYLMMPNLNGHDMYTGSASSSVNGSTASTSQLNQSSSGSNLTLLHNVPNSVSASQNWSTSSAQNFN